jgi:hypothetical protein
MQTRSLDFDTLRYSISARWYYNVTSSTARVGSPDQKYERGDDRFYQIIADRIVVEEVVCRSLW